MLKIVESAQDIVNRAGVFEEVINYIVYINIFFIDIFYYCYYNLFILYYYFFIIFFIIIIFK